MGDGFAMLERLVAATSEHHAEADADVDRYLFRTITTRDDYRAFLARVYGFVFPLEVALAETPGLDSIIAIAERSKAPAVRHDLVALGATRDVLDGLPQCLGVPAFRGPASALGWLYVVERSMLATAMLRRHLATRLPAEMAYAAAYFQLYAGAAGTKWRELGTALEQVAYTSAVGDRVIAAAVDAFRCLQRWRTQELSRSSPVRIAAG